MNTIHNLTRHIPQLSQTAAALRPLLQKAKNRKTQNTEKHKKLDW